MFPGLTCQAGSCVDAMAHLRGRCPDLGLGDMSCRNLANVRNTDKDDSLLSMVPFLSWMPLCSPM